MNKEDPALLEQLNKLYDEIKTYDADRIYNVDETGIFFIMIPNYTYILPNEDVKTARGRKKAKESFFDFLLERNRKPQVAMLNDW